jgi:hypothetical protein
MSDAVTEAAATLYRLPPEEFIAARDERVKALRADGEADAAKQVAALRKPTVGAWLVNLLVADEPELADQVSALADQLRTAQAELSGEDLRALGRQRQELVSGLVARTRGLAREAGRKVTGSVLDSEVESSLRAALADPDVARDVLSGRLTHATEFTGFGPAATSSAATPTTKAAPAARKGSAAKTGPASRQTDGKQTAAERKQAEKRERARERLDEAEQTLAAAQVEHAEAEAEATTAAEQLGTQRDRTDALRAQLDQAQKDLDQAAEAHDQARWRTRRAAAAMKAAQASVSRARDASERAER